ncbi:MAG: DUF305 domain-containing protein [Coprobacillus sp.]
MNQTYSLNSQKYLQCYNSLLSQMIQSMTSATLLSSLSMTFINQMIPLHYAAIQMSKNLLLYTTNIPLQNIACQIIENQTKSIQDMMNIYNKCSCENNQTDINSYLGSYEQISSTMFSSMKNAESNNDINISFIHEMIPHHYGAIKMSKTLLQYPICDELYSILTTIISLQEQDINQMSTLLKKLHSTKN